jgi:hypothetical protein
MDNGTIRRMSDLTDDEYKNMIEYQKKAEYARILFCKNHNIEYFNFEKCPECIHEKVEFESEKVGRDRNQNE